MAKKKYTPQELMQMAIDESRLSIPEHIDKTDPLVGALITTAEGELLAKAHRGELRVGEHCEFTLIERKLRDTNLNGCVLYVTLEPCTDASRNVNKGKRGCSFHAIKARISTVYVGIEDPNPKIATEGIKYLTENGAVVHMFDEKLQEIIRADNTQFIAEKEEEAKQAHKEKEEPPKTILEQPAVGTTINSFSNVAVQSFVQTAALPFIYPSDEFNQWGLQFGIFEYSGNNNQVTPTGLGLMLFGNHPEVKFPHAVFKVEIRYGSGNPEVKDFSGPLVQQLPAVIDFVKDKALKLTMDKSSGKRVETTDFPFDVLQEVIANAVIHRDYTIENATNYLYIDPEKIIIRSPGTPTTPLTIEDLQSLDAPSISRNPKIMYVFNQMKLAEQRGIGMRNMQDLPARGLPLPVIQMLGVSLEIAFGRNKDFIPGLNPVAVDSLTGPQKEGFLFIQQQGEVSRSLYAQRMKLTDKTAQRHLAQFKELGIVESIGVGKATTYRAAKNVPKTKVRK